jgi:hypothetical protein
MSKTIILNDIEVINVNYNVSAGKLAVEYALLDEQGVQREWEFAIFWKEMPPEVEHPHGNDEAYPPENWYLLDTKHKDNKDDLVKDIKKILKAVLD